MSLLQRIAAVSILLLGAVAPASAQPSFQAFESGPVRPIALTPNGAKLLVCNIPDNRLEIFAVAASVIDPSALREVAKERATNGDGEVSEALMNASVYGSIFIMALLQLGVILLFVFALRAVQKQAKWAEAKSAVRLEPLPLGSRHPRSPENWLVAPQL